MLFKVSTATRLPKYVAINLIRFFYKQDKQVSAKVLKDVKFPESFDLWDICDEELKEKLKPMREKLKEVQDKEMELKAKKKKVLLIPLSEYWFLFVNNSIFV